MKAPKTSTRDATDCETQAVVVANPVANTINTAAARLGVTRFFIYDELKAGRLKAKKFGSRTLILEDEIVRYAASAPDASFGKRDE